jgi:hypothetical protein
MLLRELVTSTLATYLMGTYRPVWNTVGTGIGIADTELRLALQTPNLGMGSTLQIGEELMRVASTTADHRTATIVRGISGTPAQSHGEGAYVEVNPATALVQEVLHRRCSRGRRDLSRHRRCRPPLLAGRDGDHSRPPVPTARSSG